MVRHKSALLGLTLSLAVLGMTACEDKTTVEVPPDETPLTISVTPQSVTIAEGASAQMVAQVTGGTAGGDKSVTWASSNTAVASVSANGNVVTVTGVSAGTSTIRATANADANVSAAAVVQVEAAGGNVPPTISIKSITTGATNVPVNINNVFGQIEITLNLDVPQGTSVERVELLANDQVIYTQQFSGAELGLALDEAQSAVELVASWNTGDFDRSQLGSVGTVKGRWDNGSTEVKAQVVGPQGTITANTSTTIVLNNTPFIYARLNYPTTSAINKASGLVWYTGDIVVDAMGVRFNDDATQDIGSITLNNSGSDPSTVSDSDGSNGFSLTLQKSGGSSSSRINSLETANVQLNLTSVTTAGNAGPTCIVTENSPTPVNLNCATLGGNMLLPAALNWDNVAPTITLFDLRPVTIGPCNTTACYINDAFKFEIRYSPSNNPAAPTSGFFSAIDGGSGAVNDVTVAFQAGEPGNLKDVTTGADLDETVTSDQYIATATVTDPVGNSRTEYAALDGKGDDDVDEAQEFGVDYTDPTVSISGPKANSVNDGNVWTLSASDGGVGPSGFSTTPFFVNLKLWTPTSQKCYTVDFTNMLVPAAGGGHNNDGDCTYTSGSKSGNVYYLVDDGVVPFDGALEGYWLLDAYATDLAKNLSDPHSQRTTLWDNTMPTAVGVAFPLPLVGGTNTSFTTLAYDNVELAYGQGSLQYTGAYTLQTPKQMLPGSAYGPQDGFTGGGTGINAGFSVGALIKSLQTFGGAVNPLDQASVWVYDYADLQSNVSNQVIQAAGVTDGFPSFANAAMTAYNDPTASNATVCVSTGASGCDNNSKTSTVLSVSALGQSTSGQTFANPFTAVTFWWRVGGAGTTWQQVPGTVAVSVSEDSQTQIRTWKYSLTLTTTGLDVVTNGAECDDAALVFTNFDVVGIGATSKGTGVVSAVPVTVTMSCT